MRIQFPFHDEKLVLVIEKRSIFLSQETMCEEYKKYNFNNNFMKCGGMFFM